MCFFRQPDIQAEVEAYRNRPDAFLVDVREPDEFRSGHIPGALNVPLSEIRQVTLPKEKVLCLYCLRGTRSRRAASILKQMGYEQVKSIGGLSAITDSWSVNTHPVFSLALKVSQTVLHGTPAASRRQEGSAFSDFIPGK